jgi:hypothetical protein
VVDISIAPAAAGTCAGGAACAESASDGALADAARTFSVETLAAIGGAAGWAFSIAALSADGG